MMLLMMMLMMMVMMMVLMMMMMMMMMMLMMLMMVMLVMLLMMLNQIKIWQRPVCSLTQILFVCPPATSPGPKRVTRGHLSNPRSHKEAPQVAKRYMDARQVAKRYMRSDFY